MCSVTARRLSGSARVGYHRSVIRIALTAFLLVSCMSCDNAAPVADKAAPVADKAAPTADKAAPTTDKAAPPAEATTAAWVKRETADCPAYPGKAAVTLADIEGGYTVAIATTDESAVGAIRENARYVEGAAASGAGASALTFGGATGNRTTNCPVILDGTAITVADQPGGVILTVKAKDPAKVDAIRKEARDKAEMLAVMRDAMKEAMK